MPLGRPILSVPTSGLDPEGRRSLSPSGSGRRSDHASPRAPPSVPASRLIRRGRRPPARPPCLQSRANGLLLVTGRPCRRCRRSGWTRTAASHGQVTFVHSQFDGPCMAASHFRQCRPPGGIGGPKPTTGPPLSSKSGAVRSWRRSTIPSVPAAGRAASHLRLHKRVGGWLMLGLAGHFCPCRLLGWAWAAGGQRARLACRRSGRAVRRAFLLVLVVGVGFGAGGRPGVTRLGLFVWLVGLGR
jgi:hypothetical protein